MDDSSGGSPQLAQALEVCEEFGCVLRQWVEGRDGYIPSQEAADLVDKLEAADDTKALLEIWVHANRVRFVAMAFNDMLRAERAMSLRRGPSRDFGGAVDRAKAGDDEGLRHFAAPYRVDEDHTVLHVRHMRGIHHAYVADQYEASGNRDLMLAAFHHAVAKKVGEKTTEEVMTEEDYDRLYRSIIQS